MCGAAVCSAIVPNGVKYCERHRREKQWRGGDSRRSGTTAHKARRLRVLRRDGYRCQLRYEGCSGMATDMDHVVSLAEGGADSDDNSAGSCPSCHAKKSSIEGHRARGRTVADPNHVATQSDPPMRVEPMRVEPEMPSDATRSTPKSGIPRRIEIF